MQQFVHSVIFNKDMTKVLMCDHQKLKKLNFIGGKLEDENYPIAEAYREIKEETGIDHDDIELFRVVDECINQSFPVSEVSHEYDNIYAMNVTTGVLNRDVELVEEKNPLIWADKTNLIDIAFNASLGGRNLCYLLSSMEVLKRNGYPGIAKAFFGDEDGRINF